MREITIIYRDGSDIGLGVLEETGRKFLHIRFVVGPMQGGTELREKASEVPIEDVEITEGYDYGALIEFQSKNLALLRWRGERQVAINGAREKAMAGVDAKVAKDMRAWEKENPEPTRLDRPAEDAPDYPDASGTVYDGREYELCNSWYDPYQCSLTDGHDEKHQVTTEGGTLWEWTDEEATFVNAPGLCNHTTRNGAVLCERELGHGMYHQSGAGKDKLEWLDGVSDESHDSPEEPQEPVSDFRRPTDPPTPEETQETAQGALIGADDDVDVPF